MPRKGIKGCLSLGKRPSARDQPRRELAMLNDPRQRFLELS